MPEVKKGLSKAQRHMLYESQWLTRVGDGRAIWVSISEQMLRVVEGQEVVWAAPCATSAKGAGSEANSEKTPLGWHRVIEKVGEAAPWGRVFRSRSATNKIWQRGDAAEEDLVLTRILVLAGEEPGKNKGGNVDSYARNIYVHGTNAEDAIGTPSSHGCVRLRNDDVIKAFDLTPEGALLLITE